MKVILTMDVPNVGSRGDSLEVAPGYARNYLIPRRLAMPATSGARAVLAEEAKLTGVRERRARKDAEKIAAFLAENSVFTTLKIGADGKAFGSITPKDLGVLLRQKGLEVDRRRIRLDRPLRRLGVFEVPIQMHTDVETNMKIFVDREGGNEAGATAAQAVWQAEQDAIAEAQRVEEEAREERAREAEEAARQAIERAEARKKREEEEAKAREEAEKARREAEGGGDASEETE